MNGYGDTEMQLIPEKIVVRIDTYGWDLITAEKASKWLASHFEYYGIPGRITIDVIDLDEPIRRPECKTEDLVSTIGSIIPIKLVDRSEVHNVALADFHVDLSWGSIDANVTVSNCAIHISQEADHMSPGFQEYTYIHEFAHFLQFRTLSLTTSIDGNALRESTPSFFNLSDPSDILAEINAGISKFIKSKNSALKMPNGDYIYATRDDFEHVAHFVSSLYCWPKEVTGKFPKASARFVELLKSGYYGEDTKGVFGKMLEEIT